MVQRVSIQCVLAKCLWSAYNKAAASITAQRSPGQASAQAAPPERPPRLLLRAAQQQPEAGHRHCRQLQLLRVLLLFIYHVSAAAAPGARRQWQAAMQPVSRGRGEHARRAAASKGTRGQTRQGGGRGGQHAKLALVSLLAHLRWYPTPT